MSNKEAIIREGTGDDRVWRSVYTQNEYHLAENLTNKIIVDVGANIGAFSCLAADRGADTILAIEASPINYVTLEDNIKNRSSIIGINRAVWTKDGSEIATCSEEEFKRRVAKTGRPLNYGGWHVGEHTKGDILVKTNTLQSLLREHNIDHIDLLKVDCESSEWPLFISLVNDQLFARIKEVVGEYHLFGNVSEVPDGEEPLPWLRRIFEDNGFEVHFASHPTKPEMLGWFYCKRFGLHNNCVEGIENTWGKH